jgi:hypothetical protein
VALRFAVLLFLGVMTAFGFVWFGVIALQGKQTELGCPLRNRLTRETSVEFRSFPPGWDCVCLDRRGKEVGRSRW